MRSGAGARLVAAGIFLSRLTGLVRQKVFAFFLGDGLAADALSAAFRIPNLLQNLLGEGVLSASFIPVYARLRAEGRTEEAGRVAGAVASILALTSLVVVSIGITFTPALVDLITPGFAGAQRALTIQLVRLVFPGIGILVLSAWCLGVLNSHRRFFLSYVSPVVWNGAMIAAVLFFGPGASSDDVVVTIAWASVVGSALQCLIQVPSVLRLDPGLRFAPSLVLTGVRDVLRRFGVVVLGRGVVQISGFIDTAIASLVSVGSVATLQYAQVISLLPVSLFGMSVSAAELPAMASEVGEVSQVAAALRQRLDRGLQRIAYFVIPSAAAFLLLGGVLAAGLYEGGAFSRQSAVWVWGALAGSAVGLLASTMGRLYASGLYALGDTTTPLRAAVVRVVVAASTGWWAAREIPSLLGIDARWGVGMLTAAAGIAAWMEFLWLRRVMTTRIGRTGVPLPRILTLWAIALLAGLAAVGGTRVFPSQPAWLVAAVAVAIFAAVYLPTTRHLLPSDARAP